MNRLSLLAVLCLLQFCAPCRAQDLILNGSFESNLSNWTAAPGYTIQVVSSGWSGVQAADGNKFLALSGAADVGYSYAQIVSQSRTAPFGTGVPSDNFLVYLYAAAYLHTNDGRHVSYALALEPGYGMMGSSFYLGTQDTWITAQTWGFYYAHDPYNAGSPVKPLKIIFELRDSLEPGEYLLLDDVHLYYGGPGVPEPSALLVLLAGVVCTLCFGRLFAPKHARRLPILFILLILSLLPSLSFAGLTRHNVLVIANTSSAASLAVANYYASARGIPASHVKTVTCPTGDSMSPSDFASFRDQVKAHLLTLGSVADHPESDPIKAIVLTCGIPHYVSDGAEAYGATDSALSATFTDSPWGKEPIGIYGFFQPSPGAPNAYYGDYCAPAPFGDFRANAASSTYYEAFPEPGFTQIRMLSASVALAVGGGGIVLRGTRSGDAWAWNPVRGKDKAAIGWPVSSLSVLDATHAYACTGNDSKPHGGGTVVASSDAGAHWTRTRFCSRQSGWKLRDALMGIDYADATHGWAVGTSQNAGQSTTAYMIKTTNGSSWSDVSTNLPSGFFPRAVAAGDATNVWICGAGGKIYHSIDAGSSWSLANTGAPTVDYTAIWVKKNGGAFKGWAAGKSGTIIRTEDGSNWTVQASGITSSDIADLAVTDQDHACAAYGGTSFLKYTSTVGWSAESVGLAPIVSAAMGSDGTLAAVAGNRHIFAKGAGGWGCVHTGQDTPWRLRYLVTRLDGFPDDVNPADGIPDDIKAIIDRGANANAPGTFVLDEATTLNGGAHTPTDFLDVYNALLPIVGAGSITRDTTSTYLTGQSNVIAYTSWGMHDNSANSYTTWGRPFNTWANGGVATVYESTDGRVFNRPQYLWSASASGTKYANKLTITGFPSTSRYSTHRAVLYSSGGTELASALFSSGQAQIDLSTVSWPADNKTYVQIRFPASDPQFPGAYVRNAWYPYQTSSTEIYDNQAGGFSLATSSARTLMSAVLREGASGGIANVDEPWSSYCGQSVYIFPRYAEGYTWAESAYMGLPGIGWQEVALGDPLMAPYATPPVVSITLPAYDGLLWVGTVRVTASATPTGAPGISKVEFWLDDDTLLGALTSPPYQIDLDTVARGLADGAHTVEAVAFESGSVENTGSASRTIVVSNNHTFCPAVSDALAEPNTTPVALENKPVSGVFNGFFYVEDSNRVRGIRVISSAAVNEGDLVTILGTLQESDGEREIAATTVY